MLKPERMLLEKAKDFSSAQAACEWMIEKGIIDLKRCRVWAMRKHYYELLSGGQPKMDALTATADEYCVSEDTVREAIYRNKDI